MTASRAWGARSRPLFPNPTQSENDAARFASTDLPSLSVEALRAERRILENALAVAVFDGRRAAFLFDAGDGPVSDLDWLRGRLRSLNAEIARRRGER